MSAPDLVLTGGPVLGTDGRPRYGQAVLVSRGTIAAVVPDMDVATVRGSAEVIDLHGRLLLPGFVDAHAHPVWGGLEHLACDLSGHERSIAAYQSAIAATAAAHPDWPWISGGGWSFEAFPGGHPTAAMIDAVVRERPVVLLNSDHHGVWVNSRALREAGIDRSTPDPVDGWIERDADGVPTGVLHEGAADLVTSLLPEPSQDVLDAALAQARRRLLTLGVTSWSEAILGDYTGHPDPAPAYLSSPFDLAVSGALWWDRAAGLEQVEALVARRVETEAAGLPAPLVKIMIDGIVENHTATMVEPYLHPSGACTEHHGIGFVDRETVLAAVPALEAAGFGVHMHAIGDRAVRDALDAVAVAARQRVAGTAPAVPHQVAHLQVVRPEDVPRFGRLGVVANCQPLWAALEPQMTQFTLPVLGEPRASWQYPFASIAAAGGPLAFGSDWPVSSADPWRAVHTAVTRTHHGVPGQQPFLPHEALTLSAALAAATQGSATAAGLPHVGAVAPGRRADLVVASADPFGLPRSDVGAVRSDLVLVAGVVAAADGRLV
jgi:predicted amidohydrolase YtcJ